MSYERYKDPEARREYMREYGRANRHKYKEASRAWFLRTTYGITQADYDQMLTAQNGVCALCGSPPVDSSYTTVRDGRTVNCVRQILHVDHDHTTGAVRGLVCPNCNKGLGWYEKHIQSANEYLGI